MFLSNLLFCGVSYIISCEHKFLFIPMRLYFMKIHVWGVSYFSSEHKLLFMRRYICFIKRHVWRVSYFSSEHKLLFMKRHVCFMKRHVCFIYVSFSLYETISSKLKHYYYNLSLYIPIYTTQSSIHFTLTVFSTHLVRDSNGR